MHVERVDDVVFPSLAPSHKPIPQPACAHPVFPVTLHGGARRRGVIETVRRRGSEAANQRIVVSTCRHVSSRRLESEERLVVTGVGRGRSRAKPGETKRGRAGSGPCHGGATDRQPRCRAGSWLGGRSRKVRKVASKGRTN